MSLSGTAAPVRRAGVRWLRVALPVVYVVAIMACFLFRSEPVTYLAPFAGPWAGRLYGHADCTMASVYPQASLSALAFLVAALALAVLGRRRALAGLPLLLAVLSWFALAWMSVANSAF